MNEYPCYIAGQAVTSDKKLTVYNPYTGETAGTVASLGKAETYRAIEAALEGGETLSRYQRYDILDSARRMLMERAEEFSSLIT
ncbi:MAG: aldehyde dehydrogenase family protein, partial [Planctomycetes bacterium]|nr:aldehyde dehydrogenase family protein [Planctomycetota bacterium]